MTTFICIATVSIVAITYSLAFWFEYYRHIKKVYILEKQVFDKQVEIVKQHRETVELMQERHKFLEEKVKILVLMNDLKAAKTMQEIEKLILNYYSTKEG